MLYNWKHISWSIHTDILYVTLHALRLRGGRIPQILYSSVDKVYSEYVEPDVWFDMVEYISKSNDGVRSYHETYPWLERFILPFDPEDSSEISDDFQGARVDFELSPGEFIAHIETFSNLLKIRDFCKSLSEYFGKEKEKTMDWKLRSWMELYVKILNIMRPTKVSSTAAIIDTHDSESSNLVMLSLEKFRDSNPGESYSSAAGQWQSFLQRSINYEKSNMKYKSK